MSAGIQTGFKTLPPTELLLPGAMWIKSCTVGLRRSCDGMIVSPLRVEVSKTGNGRTINQQISKLRSHIWHIMKLRLRGCGVRPADRSSISVNAETNALYYATNVVSSSAMRTSSRNRSWRQPGRRWRSDVGALSNPALGPSDLGSSQGNSEFSSGKHSDVVKCLSFQR